MANFTSNPLTSKLFQPSKPIKRKHPGTTELAKKYSAPRTGNHNTLIGFEPLKSGISPLEPGPFATWKEFVDFYILERYQRNRLKCKTDDELAEFFFSGRLLSVKGFTARDLQKMEALAPLVALDEDLAIEGVPIHPMYAKPRWASDGTSFLHLPKMPLTEPGKGYWEVRTCAVKGENKLNVWIQASNPLVWEAMLPALRIASLILTHAHTLSCK